MHVTVPAVVLATALSFCVPSPSVGVYSTLDPIAAGRASFAHRHDAAPQFGSLGKVSDWTVPSIRLGLGDDRTRLAGSDPTTFDMPALVGDARSLETFGRSDRAISDDKLPDAGIGTERFQSLRFVPVIGQDPNVPGGFQLTEVPEPSSAGLLAAAVLTAWAATRLRRPRRR